MQVGQSPLLTGNKRFDSWFGQVQQLIQLLAFEHTFFHQIVEPTNETDIDIETLYANELVYKHS